MLGLYTGIGWMANVREAVQAQWRPKWEEDPADKETFIGGREGPTDADRARPRHPALGRPQRRRLAATGVVARLFGLEDIGWFTAVFKVVPILLALGVST